MQLLGPLTIRNNVIWGICDARPAHVITLRVQLFDDMTYYNTTSRIFVQDCITATHTKKINVDPSRKLSIKLTSLGYMMTDNHAKIIMAKGKRIGDCSFW